MCLINCDMCKINFNKILLKNPIFFIDIVTTIFLIIVKIHLKFYIMISPSVGFIGIGFITFLLVFYFNYAYDIYKLHDKLLGELKKTIVNLMISVNLFTSSRKNNLILNVECKKITITFNGIEKDVKDIRVLNIIPLKHDCVNYVMPTQPFVDYIDEMIIKMYIHNNKQISDNESESDSDSDSDNNQINDTEFIVITGNNDNLLYIIYVFYAKFCSYLFLKKIYTSDKNNNETIDTKYFLKNISNLFELFNLKLRDYQIMKNDLYFELYNKLFNVLMDIFWCKKTKLPIIYTVFMKIIMYVYLFILNFVVVSNLEYYDNYVKNVPIGIINVVIIIFINVFFIVIKEISDEIIDPYGEDYSDFYYHTQLYEVANIMLKI